MVQRKTEARERGIKVVVVGSKDDEDTVSGYAPRAWGDSATARGGFDGVSMWRRMRITTIQLVLSGLRWRRSCDARRIVGAPAHIAGLALSRHHGEEAVGGESCCGEKEWVS